MITRDFITQMLDADTLDEQAELCADYLNDPVVVISPSLAIITHSTKHVIPDHTWQNAVNRGYITLEFGNSLSNWDSLKDKNRDYMTVDTISSYRRRFFRLVQKGHVVAFLNIGEVSRKLNEISKDEIDLVCHFLARGLVDRQSSLQPIGNRPEDILTELLEGSYVDRLHYLERITGTVFEKPQARRLACMNIKEVSSYNAADDSLRQEISTILPDSTAAIKGKNLYILIPGMPNAEKRTAAAKKLMHWAEKKGTAVGISDVFYDLYQIGHYQSQAEYAMQHISREHLCFYEEVVVQDMLDHIDAAHRSDYCCMSIVRIAQYDKDHNTEYLHTFGTWLENGGNYKETADALGMHRNSVTYRLQKISEEFSLDLEERTMYLSWLISYLILRMQKSTK